MIRYQARIFKDETGYSVTFPDLPGCLSQGEHLEEAKENAREALSLYLEEARDSQWQIPAAKTWKGKNYYWIAPYEDVGTALMIRQARLRAGLTQKQLAEKVGITFQQLQKLEMPGKSNPTVKTLNAISEALNQHLEIKMVA